MSRCNPSQDDNTGRSVAGMSTDGARVKDLPAVTFIFVSVDICPNKSWITWKYEEQHEMSGDVQHFPNILQSSLLIGSPFQHRQCLHRDPQYLGWTHPALLCTYPQSLSIWSAATAPISVYIRLDYIRLDYKMRFYLIGWVKLSQHCFANVHNLYLECCNSTDQCLH